MLYVSRAQAGAINAVDIDDVRRRDTRVSRDQMVVNSQMIIFAGRNGQSDWDCLLRSVITYGESEERLLRQCLSDLPKDSSSDV